VKSKLGPLGRSATYWPIVPAPGDCEDGEFGEMNGRGNRSTRGKPVPTPHCPPQIPLDQTRDWTRAAAVGSQRLTASAMARPWFLTWWQKSSGASFSWRLVWSGNWGSAHSCTMFKYEGPVTDFSEKKNCPINSSCPHVHFGAVSLQLTCGTWILTATNPALEPVYSSIDKGGHLAREAHLAEEIGWCVNSL
jgi:hypothetical protein